MSEFMPLQPDTTASHDTLVLDLERIVQGSSDARAQEALKTMCAAVLAVHSRHFGPEVTRSALREVVTDLSLQKAGFLVPRFGDEHSDAGLTSRIGRLIPRAVVIAVCAVILFLNR